MRRQRYSLCAAWTVFCLITTVSAFEHGKLLLRSNLEGAEVYLDDSFLAETSSQRRLLVEELPEGTYTVMVRKEGYTAFRRAITLTAGQTVTLRAVLKPEASPDVPPRASEAKSEAKRKPPDGSGPLLARTRASDTAKALIPPTENPLPTQISRNQVATSVRSAVPDVPLSAGKPYDTKADAVKTLGWWMAGGIGLSLLLWRRARAAAARAVIAPDAGSADGMKEYGAPPPYAHDPVYPQGIPLAADPPRALTSPTDALERRSPPHGFMRDLRRKEELFEAGLIAESPAMGAHREDRPPFETIIEVSKDEYRYEENSDV